MRQKLLKLVNKEGFWGCKIRWYHRSDFNCDLDSLCQNTHNMRHSKA